MFLWRHDKIAYTQKCYHHNVPTEEESYNERNKNIDQEYYVSMFILKSGICQQMQNMYCRI